MKKESIKRFLLEVPEDIWERWKNTIPRTISLNKALIELLKKEGEKNEK
ncbi:MAG: hypothetical protein N3D20_01175 [Candidatus Pacearchaeota archaeon]|nr:hypothetical protein [Candidatus Pacearchaeota archaeon]